MERLALIFAHGLPHLRNLLDAVILVAGWVIYFELGRHGFDKQLVRAHLRPVRTRNDPSAIGPRQFWPL